VDALTVFHHVSLLISDVLGLLSSVRVISRSRTHSLTHTGPLSGTPFARENTAQRPEETKGSVCVCACAREVWVCIHVSYQDEGSSYPCWPVGDSFGRFFGGFEQNGFEIEVDAASISHAMWRAY
jgi:hypothetical protein